MLYLKTKKNKAMKTKLFFLLLVSSTVARAQWTVMQKYSEFGKGNFYLFAATEKDARRIILETLQDNKLSYDILFNKGANLFLSTAIVDPLNSEYVYIIHSMKGRYQDRGGYHIFCYYMENRYRYFYDITEGDGRISLIYDPGVLDVSPKKENASKKD
jgi:hypothetical protein